MQFEELPPVDKTKQKGIAGLKQIAVQTRERHGFPERLEIITRYFNKFVNRMNKQIYDPTMGWTYINDPISVPEQLLIENALMKIIAEV